MLVKRLAKWGLRRLGYELRRATPRKRLVIIGCGRSGTAFAAKLFAGMGLDIGHEEMGADGLASWPATMWPHLPQQFENIFHQVREPMAAISSIQTFVQGSWDYIESTKLFLPAEDVSLRSAEYWYHWNLIAESKANLRYRLEDIPDTLPALRRELGLAQTPGDVADLVAQRPNSRRGAYELLTWDWLRECDAGLYGRIKVMASRYGYPSE